MGYIKYPIYSGFVWTICLDLLCSFATWENNLSQSDSCEKKEEKTESNRTLFGLSSGILVCLFVFRLDGKVWEKEHLILSITNIV